MLMHADSPGNLGLGGKLIAGVFDVEEAFKGHCSEIRRNGG